MVYKGERLFCPGFFFVLRNKGHYYFSLSIDLVSLNVVLQAFSVSPVYELFPVMY